METYEERSDARAKRANLMVLEENKENRDTQCKRGGQLDFCTCDSKAVAMLAQNVSRVPSSCSKLCFKHLMRV